MKPGAFPSSDALSQRATSARAAVEAIDLLIARGEYVPGQRLVEAELMARLPASRATVRAALQYLAGDGVVELLPNRGARIRRFEPVRMKEILEVVVFGIIRPSMELFAKQKISPSVRSGLEARLSAIHAAVAADDVVQLSDGFARYIEYVCVHCGNSYLQELLSKMHLRHYTRQFMSSEDYVDLRQASTRYDEVTRRLLSGDGEGAFEAMRPNAENSIARLARSAAGDTDQVRQRSSVAEA